MRNLFSTVVALLFVLALGSVASADTLDALLARNLAARGGADRLHAVKSLRLTGKATFGSGDFSFEAMWGTVQTRSGKVRSEVTLQGLTKVRAFDGRLGWTVSPFGGRRDAEQASDDEVRTLAQDADLDGPLLDWRTKGHRLEDLGTEDLDGTPARKLRVNRKDGDVQYVYLDPDTALELRITTVHLVRGTEDITETDLGGYQQVGGIWIPFSVESGGRGEPRVVRIQVERADLDGPVEDAWFALPKVGERLQRVVLPLGADKQPIGAIPATAATTPVVDAGTLSGIGVRNIGSAAMSGRVAAVAAYNEAGKTIVYVGAASGGVWKSRDGGTTFKPVFDKQPVQSIGAIAIDPSNPKTVWVGTGEGWTRNSVSIGDGIYRSTDEGETWTNVGLPNAERIVRIVVHPKASATVYACVPGKLWSDSADRGLYKTTDAGRTWALVLKGPNLSTGCSSVSMDPRNPEVLIAGLWDFRRKGWTFRSGGDGPDAPSGSGMFRSIDGGKTWTPMTAHGLPAAPWGRVETAIATTNPKIVYALIESKTSALYRSDDGGATWQARDNSQSMVWRPFYFARLVVDPTNAERLFKPDLDLIQSTDGGKTFSSSGGGSHGDWHDLWIDPANPKHVIGGDDGGLWISFDGGNRWNKSNNLPISQFYHVTVDAKDPYQVYGGLQDNSSWVGDTAYAGGISNSRWENLGGGDGFWCVVDSTDPDAVYVESQGGFVQRVDRKTMVSRDIQPKPDYKEKLRFNWNTPIYASPTQRGTIYIGSQFLFRSRDRGTTWQRISPDLTTNDPDKQKQEQSGGVTIDNSSAEMHTTIFTIGESPKNAAVIWAGTDDGNLQVTQNAGAKWTNVAANVPDLPKGAWVNWIEPSRYDAATAYAAFDRHTVGDMTPWIFRTTDYGKTWKRIAPGIRGYAHVIKEDLVERNLLFAGTEMGLWISTDAGASWAEFKANNFPSVAVRDLALQPRDHDLVIATHGRGMWIVDDLSPLRALSAATLAKSTAFLPQRAIQQRMSPNGGWVEGDATFVGANPPSGAVISYYLRSRHVFGPLLLQVLDDKGAVIDAITPTKHRGINRVAWSMRVKGPRVPRAAQVAFSASQGPRVVPGVYTVRLTRGTEVIEQKLAIGLDRRAPYDLAGRRTQFAAVMRAHAMFTDMSKLVDQLETFRAAVQDRAKGLPTSDATAAALRAITDKLDAIKKLVVATTEGGAITGEERIREHLDTLYGAINGWEGSPTPYQLASIVALRRELDDAKAALGVVATKDARALDPLLKQKQLAPLPVLSELVATPSLDRLALRCIDSDGDACGPGDSRAASERD